MKSKVVSRFYLDVDGSIKYKGMIVRALGGAHTGVNCVKTWGVLIQPLCGFGFFNGAHA